MAGLTAAAFAARSGCRVLLCEKEPVMGGLVNSFERGGFVWDAGIRALEDSGIILPMLDSLGLSVEFVKSPVSLGIEDKVVSVTSPASLGEYRSLLETLYPESRTDIGRIIGVIRRVMKHMDVLYGIENPAFKDLLRDREYLVRQLLPWLWRFLLAIGKINRMTQPVDEYLRTLTDSQPLIDIISQHFFRKTPSFFALSYFSLYLDYMYPVGGTGALPRALESYCMDAGVEVHKRTRITAVDPIGHVVCDERGTAYGYRKLVWAADLKTLYRVSDVDALPPGRGRVRARKRASLLEESCGGDSVFSLCVSVDKDPQWFAEKSHGHFFYTASREGLGSDTYSALDGVLAHARADAHDRFRASAVQWIDRYIHSTTYEISIPVLKDARLAPAGETGLIISVLFDYALLAAADKAGLYEAFRTRIEDTLIDVLDSTVYPGLRDAIIDRFSSTPLTIARTVGSSGGAITGWAFTNPVMPAVRRMQQVARSVRTDLPDVHQAGQWTYSPSGLPIAILTGKLAADAVIRGLRRTC